MLELAIEGALAGVLEGVLVGVLILMPESRISNPEIAFRVAGDYRRDRFGIGFVIAVHRCVVQPIL